MRYLQFLIFGYFIFFGAFLKGQELNLDIKINTPKLQLVDPKVFKTMEASINEFFNNTQFTEHEYEDHERIEGSFTLVILEELSPTSFSGEIRIQSLRPVYNSSYKSPLLNIVDRSVSFGYAEFQPIELSDNAFTDNFSSILTYYAYLMLAFDYDSFEAMGGEPYFLKAQNVINMLPSGIASNDNGWKTFSTDRNRYWLIDNALNPRIKNLRASMYEYHRKALDIMHDDSSKAVAVMQSALTALYDIDDNFPNSYYVQILADTKRDEIVEVFKGADPGSQKKVYDIMIAVDPAQADRYNRIIKR